MHSACGIGFLHGRRPELTAAANPLAPLWSNLTAYDAAYVALTEALEATLVTADRKLAHGARVSSDIEVMTVG